MHKTEPLASSADAGTPQPVARKLRSRPAPTNEPISACPGAGLLVGVAELDEQFEEFLYYAREVLGQSPETIRWYEGAYARYRAFLVDGEVRSGDAFMRRALDLDGWIRWNRERGVRQVTINSYWRAVRRFFVDWQKRFEGPNLFAGLKPPPVRSSVPKALSEEECRRVLEGARHYPWNSRFEQALAIAVIGIMLYAGLRRGEVVALSYDDIDLDGGTIRIVCGKGRYGGKDRVAYVAPELRHFLREYLQERRRAGIIFSALFASPRYRRRISAAAIKILVQKVRRASGVRFTPHQLRHSFVTHLLRGGTPLHVVADLAGHASLTTTIAYTRVFDEDRRDSLARFDFSSGNRRRRSTGRYRA